MKLLSVILITVTAQIAQAVPAGHLYWGLGTSASYTKQLQNVLIHAQDPDISIQPEAHIYSEGILFSDPRKIQSEKSLSTLPNIYYWGVCANHETGPKKNAACKSNVKSGILAWVRTYKADGNPINELNLFPVFFAIDLTSRFFSTNEQDEIKTWLESINAAELHHFDKDLNSMAYKSNHRSWSLAIRAIISQVLNDKAAVSKIQAEFTTHAQVNFVGTDGTTNDFLYRDALHYQVYNLEPYIWTALFVPAAISLEISKKVDAGLQFIHPYFDGSRSHIEFVNSKVVFDEVRSKAGDPSFQHKPWDPTHARKLLYLAQPLFSSITHWSQSVVDEKYSPYLKLIAAEHSK